jgi:hypothetical protein
MLAFLIIYKITHARLYVKDYQNCPALGTYLQNCPRLFNISLGPGIFGKNYKINDKELP